MKKVITIIMIFASLFLFSLQSFAHPGRTDSRGGHYDRSTGEYHYHNGEYAGREQSTKRSTTQTESIYNFDNASDVKDNNYDNFISEQKSDNKPNYGFWDYVSIVMMILTAVSMSILGFFTFIYPLFALSRDKKKKLHTIETNTQKDEAKSDEKKSETVLHESHYQSLIPEFIPTNNTNPQKPKTEIPTHEYISQKSYDKYKRRFFIIGETIAEGTYFFSKINESEPAYFSSKAEDTPITRNKQRFFLVKGERIFLFNCELEPEE